MKHTLLACVELGYVYIYATHTTFDGSELTVSRSSTNLHKKNHQHPFAICKKIEALCYTMNIADSGERTALTTL
jgi:hypothetical protein